MAMYVAFLLDRLNDALLGVNGTKIGTFDRQKLFYSQLINC